VKFGGSDVHMLPFTEKTHFLMLIIPIKKVYRKYPHSTSSFTKNDIFCGLCKRTKKCLMTLF
jgi:hypothetical protein